MRSLFVFVGVFVLTHCSAFGDDSTRFPFEATIEKDDGAAVRSGPGSQFYMTSLLRKGDRVKVYRQDSSGWLMIAPPRGSFSWVSSAFFSWASTAYHEYVEARGTSRVKVDHVAVYVGSETNPESISTIQTYLSKGDVVRVIETRKFMFNDGPREMFKIHPVKGEYRWIHQSAISSFNNDHPVDSVDHTDHQIVSRRHPRQHPDDDHAVDQDSSQEETHRIKAHHDGLPSDHTLQFSSDEVVTRRSEQPTFAGKQRLSAIDHQFREMIKQETLSWDLDSIERMYRQLDEDVGEPSLTVRISSRLDAVTRYRAYYFEYFDFAKLTLETRQRDAELQSQQALYQPQLQPFPNQFSVPVASGIQPVSQLQVASQTVNSVPSFDGAGIVRRIPEAISGGPCYALVTPNGRTLSYLQPTPGIDLNRYEGRSMGVIGKRFYRSDWNADSIAVRDLQPVQLAGSSHYR